MSKLINFYSGASPDYQGRYIYDILRFSDLELEMVHDYIQWLFPLPEPSRFNLAVPTLSNEDIETFHSSRLLKKNMIVARSRMTMFYLRNSHWIRPQDHNFLRISRILRSMNLCLGKHYAQVFLEDLLLDHDGLEEMAEECGSLQFWHDAVG